MRRRPDPGKLDSHPESADALGMTATASDFAARNVRAERARRRWSQQQLGELLGWSQSKVTAIESGQRKLSLDQAVELCKVFEVPLAKLLEGADQEDLDALGV